VFVDCASSRLPATPRAALARPPQAPGSAPQGVACANVHNAARTFVGVTEGPPLNDFAASAMEAERALRAIKGQLCVLQDAQDPGGELRDSLDHGRAEITAVRFLSADRAESDVQLQRAPLDGELAGALRTPWLLRLERRQAGWQVVSASALKR
jgi:hypothetical protein